MQSYPLKLTAAASARVLHAAANLFVYESAAAKTRTNVLLRTEEFDNAAWQKTRATAVPAPAVLSPFGTAAVEKLVEDTSANSTHNVLQRPTGLAPGRWTFSVYAKAAERTVIQMGMWDGVTGRNASFNLATGQIVYQDSGVTSKIVDAGDGWYRCIMTRDIAASFFDALIYLGNGTDTYTGNGASGAYIFGAQAEVGENATPYMRSGVDRGYSDEYENRIIVKPDNGNDIVLRPGQRFRVPPGERANQWQVRSFDGTTDIEGSVIIGSGEFEDSNTNNRFKLDASFANSVQVTNNTSQRVPVTLDTAQTLPVSLSSIQINNTTAQRVPVTLDPAQVLNTSDATVSYNKSWAHNTANAGAVAIVTAAENVNGAILRAFNCSGNSGGYVAVLAKATAPANFVDGDLLFLTQEGANTPAPTAKLDQQIVVPAGRGIWMMGGNNGLRSALVTLL